MCNQEPYSCHISGLIYRKQSSKTRIKKKKNDGGKPLQIRMLSSIFPTTMLTKLLCL